MQRIDFNGMKKLFYKLHAWLGLVSGLFVFIIALTGSLYAFQEEISSIPAYCHVKPSHNEMLSASKLQAIAESQLPGKRMNSIQFQGRERAVEAFFYGYQPSYYYKVFINPYTGEVLKLKDMNKDFFRFVIQGHYYLWLPPTIGQPLVVAVTIVFFLVLLTGVVVWFPKQLSKIKNRLVFKWKKGSKAFKINYDLHVVGGMYSIVFGIIFALTGLIFGLPPLAAGIHQLAGGSKALSYGVAAPKELPKTGLSSSQAVDSVWHLMLLEYPNASTLSVNPPYDSTSVISASATLSHGTHWKTDYRYFAPRSLQELSSDNIYGRLADANKADKLLRMNYDIHTGGILGLPGKIVACLTSLFIASLPITGIVIWWRKRKKTKPKASVTPTN